MAVPKSKRQKSSMQFIETAIDLADKILTYANGLPKRMAYRIANPLFDHAQMVVYHAMAANRIYVRDEATFNQRRTHLLDAQGHLDGVETLLTIYWKHTQRTQPIPKTEEEEVARDKRLAKEERRFLAFARLIDEERKLLSGVRKKDREAWKKQAEGEAL